MQVKIELYTMIEGKEAVFTRLLDMAFAPAKDDVLYFDPEDVDDDSDDMEATVELIDWFITGTDQNTLPVVVAQMGDISVDGEAYLKRVGWVARQDDEILPKADNGPG